MRLPTPGIVNLVWIYRERLRSGKATYERWARWLNLKQMAAALMFLQEHQLTEYDQLAAAKLTERPNGFMRWRGFTSDEADLAKTSHALMELWCSTPSPRPVFRGTKATVQQEISVSMAGLTNYRAAEGGYSMTAGRWLQMDALKKNAANLQREKPSNHQCRAAQRNAGELHAAVKANM